MAFRNPQVELKHSFQISFFCNEFDCLLSHVHSSEPSYGDFSVINYRETIFLYIYVKLQVADYEDFDWLEW